MAMLTDPSCVHSLWGQKSVLFLFYRPLIRKMRFERSILISIWTTFGLTLLAVIVATWAECNPVWHYWITKGLNDTCFKGNVQLYVQGWLLNFPNYRIARVLTAFCQV